MTPVDKTTLATTVDTLTVMVTVLFSVLLLLLASVLAWLIITIRNDNGMPYTIAFLSGPCVHVSINARRQCPFFL